MSESLDPGVSLAWRFLKYKRLLWIAAAVLAADQASKAWITARLGGWNCYYKPPGPITFRRGMQEFYAIHHGRMLEMRSKREVRIP